MTADDIQMKDCIIAYADILGSKNILLSDDDSKINNFIHNLKDLYSQYISSDEVGIKIFSDNILMFADYSEEHIDIMMQASATLQYFCATKYNLFLRGSVTRGKLYYDENFAIGEGLVNAYHLESKQAKYPLFLVDDVTGYDGELLKSNDECNYINYLKLSMTTEELFPDETVISSHRNNIINSIHEYNKSNRADDTDEKISSKLRWIADYHDNFCREYNLTNLMVGCELIRDDGDTPLLTVKGLYE